MRKNFIIYIFLLGLFLPLSFAAAGTIVSPHKYAWSDQVGYINFENVTVGNSVLGGYAWSTNTGFINFAPAQSGVKNDGRGNLSGSAWGEGLGYINFDNVLINPTTGKFSGTATGDLVGTINFDCPTFCDVETNWRPTSSGSIGGSITTGKVFSAPTLIPTPTTTILPVSQKPTNIIPPSALPANAIGSNNTNQVATQIKNILLSQFNTNFIKMTTDFFIYFIKIIINFFIFIISYFLKLFH